MAMDEQERSPREDQRMLLALGLSAVVLYFFSPSFGPTVPAEPAQDGPAQNELLNAGTPQPETPSPFEPALVADDDDSAAATKLAEAPARQKLVPERSVELNWGEVDTTWSNRGGSPASIRLRDYREGIKQPFFPKWLISGFSNSMQWEPFTTACPDVDNIDMIAGEQGVLFPVGIDAEGVAADLANYEIIEENSTSLVFQHMRGGVEITKRYSIPESGYDLGYAVELRNASSQPKTLRPSFGVADQISTTGGYRANQRRIEAGVDGDLEAKPPGKVEKAGAIEYEGEISWVGLSDKYFLIGIESEQPQDATARLITLPGEERYAAVMALDELILAPGESRSYAFSVYTGPMVLEELRGEGSAMASSIDFGIFGIVALPIVYFLKFIFSLIGSWGISIITLTLVIKGALFPLSLKANRSMMAMSSLAPEIEALKEKHGEDKEAFNKAQMALWQEHGVNPLGGCLPMLIQMPIWFALYRVLWNSVELYQASFLWFCDLTLQDPLGILAVLYAIVMWQTQRMTPQNQNMDPTQQKVLKYMPLAFSFIMFSLPSGLVLYILVSMTIGIGERLILKREKAKA